MARLLFDQNFSFRLVAAPSDLFPESQHLGEAGLERRTMQQSGVMLEDLA